MFYDAEKSKVLVFLSGKRVNEDFALTLYNGSINVMHIKSGLKVNMESLKYVSKRRDSYVMDKSEIMNIIETANKRIKKERKGVETNIALFDELMRRKQFR